MEFIDFFAGIGGFRSGLELAGHRCVGFVEINKYAVKSYRAMYETEGEYYADDIRKIKPGDLPEADCYCAGFPCQSFSTAGKRGGFEDTRGTLIFEIFRLAKDRRPKVLFLENVEGLLNHDEGKTFGTILRAMDELGYDAEWQCINSKNYIPQNRERIYIIGHLRGAGGREVFPIGGENEAALKQLVGGADAFRVYETDGIARTLKAEAGGGGAKTGLCLISKQGDNLKLRKNFSCLDANYHKGFDNHGARTGVLEIRPCSTPDRMVKNQNGCRFKDDGEPMFTLTTQDAHGVLITKQEAIGGVYTGDSPDFFRGVLPGLSRSLKANKNDAGILLSKTVRAGGMASPPGSKQNWDTYEINGRIRKLTPLECFRLQGFTDEQFYKAQAVNSDSQIYKQAGNSVTVNVIYEIGKRLREYLERELDNEQI